MPQADSNNNPLECQMAQDRFLRGGGIYERVLLAKRKSGELTPSHLYEHREYPKSLNISLGVRSYDRSTEDVKGRTREWTEHRNAVCALVVGSEEQETEARALFAEAETLGLEVHEEWDFDMLRQQVKLARERPASRVTSAATDAVRDAEITPAAGQAQGLAERDAVIAQQGAQIETLTQQMAAILARLPAAPASRRTSRPAMAEGATEGGGAADDLMPAA